MELQRVDSKSIQERIAKLVKTYLEFESRLINSRRAIVIELFNICGVNTEAGFKETKNYLLEVYKSQFENSTLFKRIIQYDFEYDGRLFTCDKMFYDEGSRLKFLLQRSGKKGDN